MDDAVAVAVQESFEKLLCVALALVCVFKVGVCLDESGKSMIMTFSRRSPAFGRLALSNLPHLPSQASQSLSRPSLRRSKYTIGSTPNYLNQRGR